MKTRVPKLDKIVKDRLCLETARLDHTLARFQALTLDVVGPLAMITDQGESGTLMLEKAIAAAKLAVKFTDNASVQISRGRAILDMNPKLSDMAEKTRTQPRNCLVISLPRRRRNVKGSSAASIEPQDEERVTIFTLWLLATGAATNPFTIAEATPCPKAGGDFNHATNQDIKEKQLTFT